MITFCNQVILVVYFLLYGMFLAVLYDILNFYLNKFKVKLIVGYIIQFIVWSGLVLLSCLFMLEVSDGYLTIYTFAFFVFGNEQLSYISNKKSRFLLHILQKVLILQSH
jgi:hypothetical protein